jgi:hypothetical protein
MRLSLEGVDADALMTDRLRAAVGADDRTTTRV